MIIGFFINSVLIRGRLNFLKYEVRMIVLFVFIVFVSRLLGVLWIRNRCVLSWGWYWYCVRKKFIC